MENLFDDDILLNDDNDVTSVFGDTAVTSLSNLVNDNLNYLKFNSYINNDIYKRHNAFYAYMDSFEGYGQYKNYFDVVTFDVNSPYSISLNIKGLLGEKYHCRHYKNCLLGVIDTNIIKAIPHITNINIEPLYDFYEVNEKCTKFLIFMTLSKYRDKNKSNLIDDEFIENIKEFILNFKDNNIYYELVFENVVFEFESIKKFNNLLPSNIKIQITGDCKIHLPDDIIAKYKQVQQDMQISLFANTYPDFDDCDNITFNIFSVLKDLKY